MPHHRRGRGCVKVGIRCSVSKWVGRWCAGRPWSHCGEDRAAPLAGLAGPWFSPLHVSAGLALWLESDRRKLGRVSRFAWPTLDPNLRGEKERRAEPTGEASWRARGDRQNGLLIWPADALRCVGWMEPKGRACVPAQWQKRGVGNYPTMDDGCEARRTPLCSCRSLTSRARRPPRRERRMGGR